ncbi:MAG: hypothetical protein J0L62_07380 [Bacteroidetes bacterium]|nr:hypothetical protein [Bacteroidota bacterium]
MELKQHFLALAIISGLSFSLFYHHISNSTTTGSGMATDVVYYLKMFNGTPLDSIPKHYRYRILHIELAKWVPDLPPGLFFLTSDQQLLFRFGIISMFSLILAGFSLWFLLLHFHFSPPWALLGTFLWMTGFYVLNWVFQLIPDAISYAAIGFGLVLVQRRSFILLTLWMIPAMLAKETSLLILPFSVLLLDERKSWIKLGLSLLPGLFVYFAFRMNFQADFGAVLTPERFTDGMISVVTFNKMTVYRLLSAIWAFHLLWIPLIAGYLVVLKTKPEFFKYLLILAPVLLLLPFAVNASTIGRLWQLGFPVFIPLILIGMQSLLSNSNRA